MSEIIDGKKYLCAREASEVFGYTPDYLSKLARENKVEARRFGKVWYLSEDSIRSFVDGMSSQEQLRLQELSQERVKEYRSALTAVADTVKTSTRTPYAITLARIVGGAMGVATFVICFGAGWGVASGQIARELAEVPQELPVFYDHFTTTLGSLISDRTLIAEELIGRADDPGRMTITVWQESGSYLFAASHTLLTTYAQSVDALAGLIGSDGIQSSPHASLASVSSQQGLSISSIGARIWSWFSLPEFAYTPPAILIPLRGTGGPTFSTPPALQPSVPTIRNVTTAVTYTGVSSEEFAAAYAKLEKEIASVATSHALQYEGLWSSIRGLSRGQGSGGGGSSVTNITNTTVGADELSDLSDILFAAPAYGDVLLFDGAKWVNAATSSLGLTGVTSLTAGTGIFLSGSTGDITISSVGGGSGGGSWSTTTSQVAGELINFPNNVSDIVAIGSNATTTAEYWFDPNTLRAFLSGLTTLTSASTTNLSASYASSTRAVFGSLTVGSLSGVLKATAGVVTAAALDLAADVGSSILAVVNGGTGWANFEANSLLLGNGTGRLATTSAGTNGQILSLVSGVPSWVATTTFSSGLIYAAGNVTNTGVLSVQQTYGSAQTGALTFATSTATSFNGLTISNAITNSSGTFTFAPPTVSGTLTVAGGGTGSTTAPIGQLIYGGALAYQSVATSTLGIGSEFSYSGTLGALVGGANGSLTLATNGTILSKLAQIAAGTILGNPTGATGNVQAVSTSTLYSGTAGQVLAFLNGAWTGVATTTFSGGLTYASGNVTNSGVTSIIAGTGVSIDQATGAVTISATGGGGGGAAGTFSTTTSQVPGQLINYPNNATDIVAIGSNATTSAEFWFDPNTGRSVIPFASSTALTAENLASTSNLVASNSFTFGAVSGFLKATAGVVATSLIDLATDVGSSILAIANGGTGWANIQANSLLLGNGTNRLATTSAGTNGQILSLVSGVPSWVATTTFSSGLTYAAGNVTLDTVTIARGGTATTTFYDGGVTFYNSSLGTLSQASAQTGLFYDNATSRLGIGTTTPPSLLTLEAADASTALRISDSTNGNYLVLGHGNTIATIGTGPGTTALRIGWDSTQSMTFDSSGHIGIGTTTPRFALTVASSTGPQLALTDTSATANPWTFRSLSGNLYIATSSPTTFATSSVNAIAIDSNNNVTVQKLTIDALSGFLKATAGAIATAAIDLAADVGSSILAIANGGTGWANIQANSLLLGNGTGRLATTSAGTNGQILSLVSGVPSWVATTTFSTGLTYAAGNVTVNTTQNIAKLSNLTTDGILYTSGGDGTLNVDSGAIDIANGGTATTTFYDGGVTFYNSSLGTLSQASAQTGLFYDNATSRLGIGTTTPASLLTLEAADASTALRISDSTNGNYLSLGHGNSVGVITTGPGSTYLSLGWNSNQTMIFNSSGNVGIGTTSPFSMLSVSTSTQSAPTTKLFTVASTTGAELVSVLGWGGVGVSSSSPWGLLSVNAPAGVPSFVVGSSTTQFIIDQFGNVGIGSTTPGRKLSVMNTASGAQLSLAYDATRHATFQVDSAGDLFVDAQGADIRMNEDNLWVCAGASCPSGSPSGNGNLIVESKVGIGTSTPNWALQVNGTRPSIGLSDESAAANLKHWLFSSQGGNLYVGTTTDLYATSSPSIISVIGGTGASAGFVGIGTSSPTKQLSVQNLLYVGAGGATGLGTATSTFQGDIRILGKLDVSTIDPVYTIGGAKYATYGASTIGIKEEQVQTMTVSAPRTDGGYEYVIDFSDLARGSDLWLFYQVTDWGSGWKDLVVTLTPGFEGRVSYEKDITGKRLIVKTDQPGEISMRLIANRYDHGRWPNSRPDQDDPFTHFTLPEKP